LAAQNAAAAFWAARAVSTKVIRAAQGPALVYPHAGADSEEANGG
jgi:hypothetical protein